MLKSIAVSALLACTGAQNLGNRTVKEMEGLEVAKGFFIGSATVDMPPAQDKKLEECMDYLEHIVKYADNIYDSFKSFQVKKKDNQGFQDVMNTLKFVSSMIHMITTSEQQCSTLPAEWDRIKEIATTWNWPLDFVVDNDKVIDFNGENLYGYFQKAINYYDKKDFENFGEQIGIASEQIMIGKMLIEEKKMNPRTDNVEKLYFQKWGGEFAHGFAFGMNMGDLDQNELYKCMAREPRAEGVLFKAYTQIQRAIYDNDLAKIVQALDTLVAFMFDLATRHEGDDWNNKICPELTKNADMMGDAQKMVMEIMNPSTTLKQGDDTGDFFFNGQNINDQINQIMDSYVQGNAKKMGFIYGNTFAKNLDDQARGNIPIIQ